MIAVTVAMRRVMRMTIRSAVKDKTTMRCIGKSLSEFQSNVNDRPTTLDEAW